MGLPAAAIAGIVTAATTLFNYAANRGQNHPKNQVKRLKQAGIHPNAIYSLGNSGNIQVNAQAGSFGDIATGVRTSRQDKRDGITPGGIGIEMPDGTVATGANGKDWDLGAMERFAAMGVDIASARLAQQKKQESKAIVSRIETQKDLDIAQTGLAESETDLTDEKVNTQKQITKLTSKQIEEVASEIRKNDAEANLAALKAYTEEATRQKIYSEYRGNELENDIREIDRDYHEAFKQQEYRQGEANIQLTDAQVNELFEKTALLCIQQEIGKLNQDQQSWYLREFEANEADWIEYKEEIRLRSAEGEGLTKGLAQLQQLFWDAYNRSGLARLAAQSIKKD